jgi:opacity protein-like surface antigen
MKTTLAAMALLATCLTSMSASAATPPKSSDTYSCEELVALGEEYAGSVIYYTKGHYDAKHDRWTDYGPGGKSVTVDEEDDYYLPVEDIFDYCVKNPKATVVKAITENNVGIYKHP